MQLNCQQEEVASHVHGRILTIAGPGSGKTRTLTERTGRLVRGGINPANILCLTFTNKARDEMQERLAASYGTATQKVFVSNFHGLCGAVLRKMGAPLGYTTRMTVCDSDDQVDLIMQVARKKGMEPTRPQARFLAMIVNDCRENLADEADLEAAGNGKISGPEARVLLEYVRTLRQRNQCDFSGLLSETVRLLRQRDDVRLKLQSRFRFIQVDEYQDTNRAQNEIVELLADAEDNVLAVGDADQSIYEWRGASPDAMKQFSRRGEAKTGRCRIVKLGVNYRSTPQIVQVADALIRHCSDRIAVDFSTTRKPGDPAKCARCANPEEEAEGIATSIASLVRQDGVPPREIAVFYRANDMSRLVEQALAKRQLPYLVVGGGSYYDRMEVKDVLSMLHFLCNPKDGIAFHRIANKPARGMGDALIGKLESFAEKHDLDLLSVLDEQMLARIRDENDKPLGDAALKACREVRRIFGLDLTAKSVGDIANEVLDRSQYDQWLKDKYEADEYETRRRNVNELTNSIVEFSRANRRATIADYLQSIALYTGGESYQDDNAIRLMSLHASKGLEFDVVYMIGVEHGILPHEKAIKDRADRGVEEERRLCYVGFTRARKLLRVTWCQKRQDTFSRGKTARFLPSAPSRFLLEAGLMSKEEYQSAVEEAAAARKAASPPKRPTPVRPHSGR
ncbi:MAG TPA: UvrD-helicase domain-containing protein [Tepidisphaeraceae bacterium]|nr:UvrD-helicase domain-containing protein [Tepidisphaeraceae bacterium]